MLNTNIPFNFNDGPIHFYTENDDFTVCGVTEWMGHYCDEFGVFTIRSEKEFRDGVNVTITPYNFNWWDVFDETKYSNEVLVNEFVSYDDGQRRYKIPFKGVWCTAVYQDGHHLSQLEVGQLQTHGELSVVEWMEMKMLLVLCIFELITILLLMKKPVRRTSDVIEWVAFILLYHWCWRCYLSAANHKSTSNEYTLLGWALFTASLNILAYRKLFMITCSFTPSPTFISIILLKNVFSFLPWSHHWVPSFIHNILELITWVYIARYTSPDLSKARKLTLIGLCIILGAQYVIINSKASAMCLTSDATEKTRSQRMIVFTLELMSQKPEWFVMDKLCWVVVIVTLSIYH